MARAKGIIFAFISPQIARKAAKLTDGMETLAAACHQFMNVCLVSNIPDQPIFRRIKHEMERQRQFDGSQIWREMPTTHRDGFDNLAPYLRRQLLKLWDGEFPEVGWTANCL